MAGENFSGCSSSQICLRMVKFSGSQESAQRHSANGSVVLAERQQGVPQPQPGFDQSSYRRYLVPNQLLDGVRILWPSDVEAADDLQTNGAIWGDEYSIGYDFGVM